MTQTDSSLNEKQDLEAIKYNPKTTIVNAQTKTRALAKFYDFYHQHCSTKFSKAFVFYFGVLYGIKLVII